MEIQQLTVGAGTVRRPPVPNGPLAEVLLDEGPVGFVHVTVEPGGAMPEHDHGASAVALIPLAGEARLLDGDRTFVLPTGTVTTIPIGRRVRLENPGAEEVRLIVVVSPPDFAKALNAWPER